MREIAAVSPRNCDKQQLTSEDMIYAVLEDVVLYTGKTKPSIDTPVQLKIYEKCPVNFMIHGHAFIKGADYTKDYYFCGDVREADEVSEYILNNPDKNCVNLRNHGFLLYAKTIEELEKLELSFDYIRTLIKE